MQQCCTLCTLPRCQAGKGGAAATSGHPTLGPGHGRGAVVGPLPRSGSRTNPHRKGGAGLKRSKNADRHPGPLEGTWWTEHGQGSENHPGEVAGRTRLGRVTRFSPCLVSLPERGAEPCDPPGPHLWRRATHAQRSPRGKLRGHRPVRAARPGPRLVPFRLCRLAVCDPGHVTCIPGASISPRYANYSSEKK